MVLDNQVSGPASAAASALEQLREKIDAGQSSVKGMSAALKALKGSSEEVKKEKDELSTKIQAEKNALAKVHLELLKQGTTYEKVSQDAKKLEEQKKKLTEQSKKETESEKASTAALKATGGPIGTLKGHVEELGEIFRSGGALAGGFTLAVAGLTAGMVALGTAAVAGAASLGKWIVESANTERTLRLQREAMTGDAESARNLGDQIALTASKVSLGREKLDDLAKSLTRTRLTGQEQVDTFNLVSQAADAMGDDVGNAFKAIATRGQMFQRLQISPMELLGTGVDFNDVAGDLAKAMGVSLDKAKQALFSGQVKLDAGLKSLRTTIDKRFAEINAKKALDINVQITRMRENFGRLTRDVNLEPLAKGVKVIADNFDESTVTGKALHDVITKIGDMISGAFGDKAPVIHKFVQGVEIAGLTFAISLLKMKKAIVDSFGPGFDTSGLDLVKDSMLAGKTAAALLGGAIMTVGSGISQLVAVYHGIRAIQEPFEKFGRTLRETDWKGLGETVWKGLVDGLTMGPKALGEATMKMGVAIKDEFKSVLGIHSPSAVFADYGEQTAAGYQKGVERSLPTVQSSMNDLAGPAPKSGGAGGGRGASVGRVEININIPAGASGSVRAEVEKATAPLMAELTKFFEDLNVASAAGTAVAA